MPLSLGVGVGLRHTRVTDEAGVIRARSADIIYTGQTPSIIVDRLIDATSAGVTYTGQTANVDVRTTIAATSAGITYTGQTATVSVGGSAAQTLAGSETNALAIVFADDSFKSTTGFNGSVYCLDSGTPANDYDSSPTTEAASYFTYTSPSPKMILHDDGVLKYAAHNLITYSDDFTNAAWSKAHVSATGDAVTVSGYTLDRLEHSTTTSAQHIATNGSIGTSYLAGAQYRVSVVAQADEENWLFIRVRQGSGSYIYAYFNISSGATGTAPNWDSTSITDLGSGLYRCVGIFTQSSGAFNLDVSIGIAEGDLDPNHDTATVGEGLYVGACQVHRYPADTTYLKTTSAARYADPIEFNSSGTALGALVEPQRTNLLTYSNTLSNAAWVETGNATPGSLTGPNGLAAYEFVEDTASAFHRIFQQGISYTATTVVTFSVYLKYVDCQYLAVAFSNNATGTDFANLVVDIQNGSISSSGAVGTATLVGTDIKNVGSGWYRVSLTASDSSATSINYYVATQENSTREAVTNRGLQSFTGTSRSFGIAMAQAEVGSSATSPIETYGSTVTRAADNISKATSGFPYSGTAGTIYVEGKTPKALAGDPILVELSSDANNRMDLFSYTAGATYWFGRNGSGTQWGMALDAVAADTSTRLAGAYASNDFQGCSDGNLGSADTSGSVPTCTTIYIGNGRGGSQGGNHIKAILYVPRRVSNADMQTLTSTGALP